MLCLRDLLTLTLSALVREAAFTGRKSETGEETSPRSESKSRTGSRASLLRSRGLVPDSAIGPSGFLISLHLDLCL